MNRLTKSGSQKGMRGVQRRQLRFLALAILLAAFVAIAVGAGIFVLNGSRF